MSKKFLSPIKLAQGASNPASGSAGEIFYNTTDKTIYTHDGSGWGTAESSLPAGTMVQWAGAIAPTNWLLCDGTAVSRTTYATLFAAIGTAYGVGDGSTTFNLPDLRGRIPVGKNGGSFGTLGGTGGAETVTLTANNLPAHTHPVSDPGHYHGLNGTLVSSFVGYGQNSPINGNATNPSGNNTTTSATTGITVGNNSTTNSAVNNLQPYQVVNYIIKATSGTTAGDSPLTARVSAIETTTVRSVALGGTGASTLTGYVKGSGTSALTASSTIPGSDISGNISGTAGNVSGTVAVGNGGTGATTLASGGYLKGNGASAITSQSGIPAGDITSGILSTARGGTGSANGAGLIPMVPTAVYVASGSASISAGGIVTFSGTNYITFAGAFGSNSRYLVQIAGYSGPGSYLGMRGATNGSGNSAAAYYDGGMYRQAGATGIWTNQSGTTQMQVGYVPANEWWQATVEVLNPNNSNAATFMNRAFYMGGSGTTVISDGKFNGTSNFDGLQFWCTGGGTFAGTIRILEYRN